jgi:hypothetical protein
MNYLLWQFLGFLGWEQCHALFGDVGILLFRLMVMNFNGNGLPIIMLLILQSLCVVQCFPATMYALRACALPLFIES